ncbi:zinc-dependent metalloprotease [Mangrovimonas sp. TPBH4]|uniref:zinc-dependent metalloprotease n=1 Tax=Mangrovimonas sp. TPBH4 TaxID=1645914 RepID=UPI0009E8E263|nr:zinc-dependent metalloprotease [Mangrovimonas sp. TPBH4]
MKCNYYSPRLLTAVMAGFLAFTPMSMEAQRKNKKKKSKDYPEAVQKPASNGKSISELIKTSNAKEGLFTVYQDTITGSIKMLITEDQIGKEFIYFSQIMDGVMEANSFRGAYGDSKVVKIKKYFNNIEFETQNTSFYFDPSSPLANAKDANTSNGVMASLKIEAHDSAKGLYLIDADDLFLKETFTQIKPPRYPGQSPMAFSLGNLDKGKSKILNIKSYPNNTDLAVEYVYSNASVLNGGSDAIADGRNVSIEVYHSLIEMPDNDYEIRFDDPRVGYFTTQVDDQTSTGTTPYRDLIHRWNLVKKNPSADLSEPVKPITWWIENTTPLEWRETIMEGVLAWNEAFEKAGFLNAVQVKFQPDDAEWDAGDINYNVLRWASSSAPRFGGYGPSFANPKTGEILGADIMLEYLHFTNRVFYDKLYGNAQGTSNMETEQFSKNSPMYCSMGHVVHENLMFGNTMLQAYNASDLEMARMKKEAMKALIMHEVGHTLGLNHNMKASQIYTPEQLADPEFIKGKCLTGSVMDYAPINLSKDPATQGQYYDTAVGPYDVWAIQLGYTPFKSKADHEALLAMSTRPELVFGNDADDMRSPGKAIDPRVNVGDMSSDAIQYAVNTIELSRDLMDNIRIKFSNKGNSYDDLKRAYNNLIRQEAGAAGVISRYIGGVYVDRAMIGQEGATQPYTPVSLEDQKRAMDALDKYVFAPDAFTAPSELYNYLASKRRGQNFFRGPEDIKIHDQILSSQKNVLRHLLHPNTLQRITDSEMYGNQYKMSTFMVDLTNAIFKADIYGDVSSTRQNLQVEYTKMLIEMLTGKQSSRFDNNAKSMALYNLNRIKIMAAPYGNISTKAHKMHLTTLIDNALKEIK